MITSILGWILFGLLVGAIARFVLPGRDPMGWIATIMLGIAGSFLGGFLVSLFTGGPGRMMPAQFLGSLIGAVLLLLAVRAMSGNRARSR